MTDLKAQKWMATGILDVGKSRAWSDPEGQVEIAEAITRKDTRELVDRGTIRTKNARDNPEGRVRKRAVKRSYSHRRGAGSRGGRPDA